MPEITFTPPEAQLNNKKEATLAELNSDKTRNYIISIAKNINNKISNADAEEVAQNAMLKANQEIEKGQFKYQSNLKTWLYTIVERLIIGILRHDTMKRRKGFVDAAPEYQETKDEEPIAEQKLIEQEALDIREEEIKNLKSDIAKLPPLYRAVMELVTQGKRPVDIAKELNIPYPTARTRIKKAKEIIDEILYGKQKT
ncbi:MAG: RNA polymerase sigma factor [Candidatus Magasanikbacteria bacterium]|nr:RNA polymerase sigma factor [Candidatus Magasanikbacteria bacterium]